MDGAGAADHRHVDDKKRSETLLLYLEIGPHGRLQKGRSSDSSFSFGKLLKYIPVILF